MLHFQKIKCWIWLSSWIKKTSLSCQKCGYNRHMNCDQEEKRSTLKQQIKMMESTGNFEGKYEQMPISLFYVKQEKLKHIRLNYCFCDSAICYAHNHASVLVLPSLDNHCSSSKFARPRSTLSFSPTQFMGQKQIEQ